MSVPRPPETNGNLSKDFFFFTKALRALVVLLLLLLFVCFTIYYLFERDMERAREIETAGSASHMPTACRQNPGAETRIQSLRDAKDSVV